MNLLTQFVLGIALVFAIQAFKFGPSQAHLAVGRIGLKWIWRVGGLFASSKDKVWLTPGSDEVPSGRLAFSQNAMAGDHTVMLPKENLLHCLSTGTLDEKGVAALRASYPSAFTRMLNELVPESHERPCTEEGIPSGSIWIDTDLSIEDEHAPVLLYLHGGAAIAGDGHTEKGFAYSLHKATGLRMLSLNYPLAPEHPAPAAGASVATALKAPILRNRRVILVGTSGGGLPVLQSILDHGAKPQAAVLLSPMVSSTPLPSHKENTPRDFIADYLIHCAARASYPTPKHVSLLDKDWSAVRNIPLYFQVSASEVLLDDSKYAAAKVEKVGGKVTLDIYPHGPHAMALLQDIIPEAGPALLRIAEWVKEQVRA